MRNFNLKNESGDKKYFTQIPNIIVNHSTAYEQSLYLIMKRLAGEGGQCFASINYLAQNMGVDKKTVTSTIAKLLKRQWIQEAHKTKVRGGSVRTFIIIDLWKLNMDNYESGRHVSTQKSGSITDESGRQILESGSQTDTSKNSNKNYKKETFFSLNNLINDFKNGNSKLKPYYLGDPMVWKKSEQRWYVIDKYNQWLKYADKESRIEWK